MKVLVAGCGSIGKRHAKNVSKLAETAVVDKDPKIADKCAGELGVQAFPNLEDALAWKPHGVIVAAPPSMHLPIARAAVETGADVLVEKPLSHTMEGVNEFIDRAEALGCKVFVVCNMRFHPAISTLSQNLAHIGRPLFARAHYGNYLPDMRPGVDYRQLYSGSRAAGGGIILDGIHELDYLVWLFGPVAKVWCNPAKLSDLQIETEDYAAILLQHTGGVASEIHLDYLRLFKRRGCEIVGHQGMLLWQSEGKNPEKCSVRLYNKNEEKWETLFNSESLDANAPYEQLAEYFIKALKGHAVPLLKGREAAQELAVALRALEAFTESGAC